MVSNAFENNEKYTQIYVVLHVRSTSKVAVTWVVSSTIRDMLFQESKGHGLECAAS